MGFFFEGNVSFFFPRPINLNLDFPSCSMLLVLSLSLPPHHTCTRLRAVTAAVAASSSSGARSSMSHRNELFFEGNEKRQCVVSWQLIDTFSKTT